MFFSQKVTVPYRIAFNFSLDEKLLFNTLYCRVGGKPVLCNRRNVYCVMKRSQGGDRQVTESYKFLTCNPSLILKYKTKTVTFLKQPKLQTLQEKFITLCTWLGRSLIKQYILQQVHNTVFQPVNCKSIVQL